VTCRLAVLSLTLGDHESLFKVSQSQTEN